MNRLSNYNYPAVETLKQSNVLDFKKIIFLCLKLLYYYSTLILKKINETLFTHQWVLFYDYKDDVSFSINKNIIKPPKNKFYADPFILSKDDSHYIFYEEYNYKKHKGHISAFKLDKYKKIHKPKIIIEQDYHLSYPFIFEYANTFYMIPEGSKNNTIDIYECTKFP